MQLARNRTRKPFVPCRIPVPRWPSSITLKLNPLPRTLTPCPFLSSVSDTQARPRSSLSPVQVSQHNSGPYRDVSAPASFSSSVCDPPGKLSAIACGRLLTLIRQLEDSTSHHIVAQCESSPVHRVLSHEPLLGLILRFALNTEGRGGRASVAAFALTCQDMYNVAVRVLWERMDNICPLAMTARRGVIWECTKVQGPLAEWVRQFTRQ